MHTQKKGHIFFLLTATLILAAGELFTQPMSAVLATIGSKNITVYDFMQRSEMTVRPNPFKDKNTTLNNLIVEKILALEVETTSPLQSNPMFQARLKGIKEQAMREKLYYDVAFTKAKVDTSELKKAYRFSIREYEVEYYRMRKELAQKVKTAIDSSAGSIDEIFQSLTEYAGKQPVHKVTYNDEDNNDVHEALYTQPLKNGDVIGPIAMGSNDYLIMRVKNWTAYPLLSEVDQQKRWNEVKEREHRLKAMKMWQSYQASVMSGKGMDFNGKTLNTLSQWVRTKYISEQQKIDSAGFQMTEIPPVSPAELDLSLPFFTFENKTWTVGDFKNELMSHPLVFRTTQIDSANFKEQFKLAVVDIIRDYCLTREAYKKKLDQRRDVERTVELWKDAYIANDAQKNIVDTAIKEGTVNGKDEVGILHYWESYVHGLQKKYSSSIHVDTNVFKSISLTTVDMVAIKPGMPYPAVVPNFPTYIMSENLDYTTRRE